MKTARLFNCLYCHRQVKICSACDRGNIYCGPQCSRQARQSAMLKAGQRYQNTLRGKLKHALRQKRYRERQNQKVTHQSSPKKPHKRPLAPPDNTITIGLICDFCQKQVSNYLRLDFLHQDQHARHKLKSAIAQAP